MRPARGGCPAPPPRSGTPPCLSRPSATPSDATSSHPEEPHPASDTVGGADLPRRQLIVAEIAMPSLLPKRTATYRQSLAPCASGCVRPGPARLIPGRGTLSDLNNLANPKIIVFFIAFLPQFIVAEGSTTAQFVVLGIAFLLVGLALDLSIGAASGRPGASPPSWVAEGSRPRCGTDLHRARRSPARREQLTLVQSTTSRASTPNTVPIEPAIGLRDGGATMKVSRSRHPTVHPARLLIDQPPPRPVGVPALSARSGVLAGIAACLTPVPQEGPAPLPPAAGLARWSPAGWGGAGVVVRSGCGPLGSPVPASRRRSVRW